MASKEVMASAPLMVLLYDRTFVSGSFRVAWRRHGWLWGALAATWVLLGYLVASGGIFNVGSHNSMIRISREQYLLTEPGVIFQYLRLSVWPHPLCLDYYGLIAATWLSILPPVLGVAVLLAATVWALRANSVWGFIGAWFFLILAPTSSFLPLDSPMYEHRMYLPLAAVVAAAVLGAFEIGQQLLNKRQGVVLGYVAGGAVVALTFLTIQRNQDYNSAVTIWRGAVEMRPNNPRALYNLGAALLETGKLQDAIGYLEQAVRIQPNFADAHNSMGVALAQAGRVQEAITHYERALQIKPNFADAHNNLGIALMRQGRLPEAIGHYEQALRIQPDYVQAQCNWANALLRMGNLPEAIGHYEEALRIKPDFAEAHFNVGLALEKLGRTSEAIQHYQQTLRIKPEFVQARDALARLHAVE
jgi:tetratricopeptide (TPR) repeat protein